MTFTKPTQKPVAYQAPHMRSDYTGISQEAYAFIKMEAAGVAERLTEQHKSKDPAFLIEVARQLIAWADRQKPKAQPAKESIYDGE